MGVSVMVVMDVTEYGGDEKGSWVGISSGRR